MTPTVLDLLGLLPAFEHSLAARPSDLKGQSLKGWLEGSLSPYEASKQICAAQMNP
jgi:hypothetical protein